MITVNGKTYTEQELIELVKDSTLIASYIRMDIEVIKENDDTMDYDTYYEFSKKY